MDSLELASRFSLPPNMRGYCGKPGLLDAFGKFKADCASAANRENLRAHLETLPLMCSYLQLIADANGIDDKFDYEVVEGFWIGNRTIERVRRDDAAGMFLNSWPRKGIVDAKRASAIIARLPKQLPPMHHSFHVYIAEFASKKADRTVSNKDKCRPSWGEVVSADGGTVTASIEPVRRMGGSFSFGEPRPVRLSRTLGKIFTVGDGARAVAAHWMVAVKELDHGEARRMRKYTESVLSAAPPA